MKNLPVDLESSQHHGEQRRLSSYFRISLNTLTFAILKISSNKNCVYCNLHHQCFERQYVAQFMRYFGVPYLLYPNSKTKLGMQESSIF